MNVRIASKNEKGGDQVNADSCFFRKKDQARVGASQVNKK